MHASEQKTNDIAIDDVTPAPEGDLRPGPIDAGPVTRVGRRLLSRLARLDRLLERGTVQLFGVSDAAKTRRLSTGLGALDDALGGGLPCGRVVEIAGAPSSGKTMLALALCRAAQAQGGVAAYVDAEHGLSVDTLARAGVQGDRLVIARPDGGEQALHVVDELLRARAASIVVVDSVAALVPAAELNGVTGGAPAGHLSRLMSQSLRRLSLECAKAGAVVVFVNQFRRTWGEDGKGRATTTGGAALHYAASTRLVVMGDSAAPHDAPRAAPSSLSVLITKARFNGDAVGKVVAVGGLARPRVDMPPIDARSDDGRAHSSDQPENVVVRNG